jgi:hypothetical protein
LPLESTTTTAIARFRWRAKSIALSMMARTSASVMDGGGRFDGEAGCGGGAAAVRKTKTVQRASMRDGMALPPIEVFPSPDY